MPRFILQKVLNNYDPTLNRIASGVECGSVAYVVATNPINVQLPLVGRCAVAGVAWYFYEQLLDDKFTR
jgi:hypothetical protein